MVVKLDIPPEFAARVDALAPLAPRTAIARRLLELGLERAESHPEELARTTRTAALVAPPAPQRAEE